jgi:DNA-binding MarR family transcriptional regulator
MSTVSDTHIGSALSPEQRRETIDAASIELVHSASLLTRLAYRKANVSLPRSEVTILATLIDGPQRITTLAELEGLAQPTVTQLVKRLEERGWVTRGRDDTDGRVTLVRLTESGAAMIETVRDGYRPVLRSALSDLADAELTTLQAATEVLGKLVEALQSDEVP